MLTHLVQVAIFVVVDDAPTQAPSRQAVNLGDGSSSNHWDILLCCKRTQWLEFNIILIYKSIVNFISNYGKLSLVGDIYNLKKMIPR